MEIPAPFRRKTFPISSILRQMLIRGNGAPARQSILHRTATAAVSPYELFGILQPPRRRQVFADRKNPAWIMQRPEMIQHRPQGVYYLWKIRTPGRPIVFFFTLSDRFGADSFYRRDFAWAIVFLEYIFFIIHNPWLCGCPIQRFIGAETVTVPEED